MFGKTAHDYLELNAEVGKNPAKRLSAPALVWHLGFWTNFSGVRPIDVRRAADRFIRTLCVAIQSGGSTVRLEPNVSGLCLLFSTACNATTFSPEPPRTHLQEDIFKSTGREVLLKFDWKGLQVSVRFEVHTEYFSISTFIELIQTKPPYSGLPSLNAKIDDMLQYLSPDISATSRRSSLAANLNSYFFSEFWTEYENDIFSNPGISDFRTDPIFRNVFADFRGLILSERAANLFGGEGSKEEPSGSNWGRKVKDALLPLIHRKGSHDHTANYMLRRQALYLSALGPPLHLHSETERSPVEFIVYLHHTFTSQGSETIVNRRQLARLVNQIILLGTLRLCALKHLRLLHKIGRLLSLLDKSTQKARVAIASYREDANEEAGRLIQRAHSKFNAINGRFLKATGSGLLYRIERSRYYVRQFKAGVRFVRIDRLEGDQPYHEFVSRHLGGEFDFIDRLGIRLDRATNNIVNLDQNYLTIRTNKIDEDIQRIQQWGEIALVGALVPYYMMHLVDLIFEEVLIPPITILVWTFFGIFALVRKLRPNFSGYRQALIAAVVASIVLAISLYAQRTGIADWLHLSGQKVHRKRSTENKNPRMLKLSSRTCWSRLRGS